MRVLVTGSEGFLGQELVRQLQVAGHEVRGVDNFSRRGRIERVRAYDFLEGDLTQPEFADRACRDVDVVFQCAAAAYGVVRMHAKPADLLYNDVVLHAQVLRSCVRNRVKKLAFVSSSMPYETATRTPMEEDDTDNSAAPRTEFGISKIANERLCQAYGKQYGLRYVIWRPFNILSPGERAEAEAGAAHVYADFIKKIVIERRNPVQILGDGLQVRSFLWVGEVARAIAAHSFEERTDGRTYNLADPTPVTILELANRIHQRAVALGLLPKGQALSFSTVDAPQADVRRLVPSIRRAQQELGWSPRVSLDQALDSCILDAVAGSARPMKAGTQA